MATVIGFQKKKYTFDDGNSTEGFSLFIQEKRDGVTGLACERMYVSNAKMGAYIPVLGDEIRINYNRWGKPQEIILVEPARRQ